MPFLKEKFWNQWKQSRINQLLSYRPPSQPDFSFFFINPLRHCLYSFCRSLWIYRPKITSAEQEALRLQDFHYLLPPQSLSEKDFQYLLPPQSLSEKGRYTIVLDLDYTLICANAKENKLFPEGGPQNLRMVVHQRPYMLELLGKLKPLCELVLWTAGTDTYAKEVLSKLKAIHFFQHSIYRNSSWYSDKSVSGHTKKQLSRLGREKERTIIVDDNPSVCVADKENAIIIVPFKGKSNDQALVQLERLLVELIDSDESVPCFLQRMEKMQKLFSSEGFFRLRSSNE